MPISIVNDVKKRCQSNKLRGWESDLKTKRGLSCSKLGEAVASIIENKMKKQSQFSQQTKEELYQSLQYIDPIEVDEIMSKHDEKVTYDIKGREIFATGIWKKDKYTEADLDEMIKAFEELDFKPALKLHHEKNKENEEVSTINPALGYVDKLYRKGKKLLADFSGIPKKVFEAIQNKAYNRVSSEIAWNFKRGEKTFKRVLCGVALLGADIPAVADLDTLNSLYSYSSEDDIHCYDLQEDREEGETVNFGGLLDWDDTKESYIYWAHSYDVNRNQIDNVEKEEIDDGVMKLFKSREIVNDRLENETIKDIVGWQFGKSNFNLAQAKAWINKRRDNMAYKEDKISINTIPESAGDQKNNNKEDDMADEKLKEQLEALQKQLSDSQQKIQELEANEKSELENKTKEFSEKMETFSKEKEELETKLKELEEKEKEFSEKVVKLSEENKKYSEEKVAAEKAAKEASIKVFVDENKQKGKILPKFENHVKALLSLEGEKVCKFSVKEGDQEIEKEFSVGDLVKEMIGTFPNMVPFGELSRAENVGDVTDAGDLLDKKIHAYMDEHKVKYAEAHMAVLKDNPNLRDEYLKGMN